MRGLRLTNFFSAMNQTKLFLGAYLGRAMENPTTTENE